MIKSMTGCGRAEKILPQWKTKVTVEVRTVNHKFLEVATRLPAALSGFESELREIVRGHLRRGYVQLSIALDETEKGPSLMLDRALVRDYLQMASELRTKHHLTGTVDVNTVMQFPGVIKGSTTEETKPKFWAAVKTVVERAFTDLKQMRAVEGATLMRDLKQAVAKIVKAVKAIEKRVPQRLAERRGNLLAQLKSLNVNADPKRLIEEVAFISERLDIHEECVRLQSHCQMFSTSLNEPGTAGKKLDFILQEMLRETDTLSAKARDSYISHRAITIKEEIERLKEQVRNVE
jgi:uncharacterized protein (TIGR00255 family)